MMSTENGGTDSHKGGGRTLLAFRAVFVLSALAALVFGYVGFDIYLDEQPGPDASPLDVAHNVLQLFVLSTPALDVGGPPYPWTLEIARFAAPLTTIHALAEGMRLLLADRLKRWRISRSTGHAVVCGNGPEAEVLTTRLRARGTPVVWLQGTATATADAGSQDARELILHEDPRQPEVLSRAGIANAEALYVFGNDAAANTAVAQAARRRKSKRDGPRATYIEIPDSQLCAALRARRLGSARATETFVDFFNLDDLGGYDLVSRSPQPEALPRGGAVVIVGLSDFGAALLVELARSWRFRNAARSEPLFVTVVDPHARSRVEALVRRYPFIEDTCALLAHEDDLAAALPNETRTPVEVFICHDDEEHDLATMLSGVRLWQLGDSVTVRLEHLAAFRSAAHGDTSLLDDIAGRMRLFSVIDAACDPDLIATGLTEQLARAHHEYYAVERLREGETRETHPQLVPWHALDESYRRANRDAMAHIGAKLATIGCALAPNVDPADAYQPQEREVEHLAVMEHERWMRERQAEGWSYAPERDGARKHHPDLLPWGRVSETTRNTARAEARALPALLGEAGFQIIRFAAAPGDSEGSDHHGET